MISFRHRSNVKRIKIKTNKKLDQRMSGWLQKVFNIKNPIVGFKSHDNKYYDVETFYLLIEHFYNSQVEIVQSNEQPEISFTSDNLNSSSFIRPSQPNTSELNHKGPSSEEEDVIFVSDLKTFEKRLGEGKEISILFDIHVGYKRQVLDGVADLLNSSAGVKTCICILINNNHPKKSSFSIYMGKNCVVVIPLTLQYKSVILNAISKVKHVSYNYEQNRALKPQVEDEAPSFTTHHLQERLNQDACFDYLGRMNRQKFLSSYEYHKLLEKVEDNFSDFYKIFCDGVLDNDYESFKNEIRLKVENNLEMLLSNVEEMDLSRPISREEQRKQTFKKNPPEIEIVKVENYFEVLDLIKDRLDPKFLGDIKQHLLDQNQELCSYFSKFLAREYGKEELTRKVTAFAKQSFDDLRPVSRCVPRSKSTEGVRKDEQRIIDIQDLEQAPMFGSLNIPSENVVSPIKNMSDIESLYKLAWEKLQAHAETFTAEEYGLLYHYLQTNNDCILNFMQALDEESKSEFADLKSFLAQKMSVIMSEHFSENELVYLASIKNSVSVAPIFENFRYECDISSLVAALKEEITRAKIPVERVLHKKSSDSQLLEKCGKQRDKRKFSDQNQDSPSPRQSDISLYQRGSEFSLYNLRLLANPWADEFEEMLRFCNFGEPHKQEYLRSAYADYNPSLFMWVRDYIKNKETNHHSAQFYRDNVNKREWEQRGLLKILPLYSELLKEFEREGKLTQKMRKWAIMNFMQCSLNLLGSFELYLFQKDQEELLDSIRAAFNHEDKEMELYRVYSTRIETMLKEMCINNQASLEIFKQYPLHIKSFIDVYYFTGNFEDLMENLHTLETHHIQKSKLTVATLNFSGINTNPFEYDDGSELFSKINENVQEMMKIEVPNMVDWKVGKIDKDFCYNARLSVAFNKDIDSIDGRLLTREQFATLWRSKFDNWEEKEKVKATQEEISMSILMDYIFYRSLLKYVYNAPTFQELDANLKTYDARTLNEFLAKKFDRPASKLDIKEDNVITYLLHQKIDVFCLQEAGCIDWKEQLIPEYAYHKNHDSVILYRKEKFGRVRQDLMDQYGKDLDFNNDTSFLFTSKNYLIISAHLKSKKIHFEQAEEMFKTLRSIKEEHPLLRIVIGMDANHFLVTDNFLNTDGRPVFNMVPDSPERPTTVKKRSFMQAQYKKGGVEVSEVKDEIVTTHKIVEWGIERIDGKESTGELLPNDEHPYDHYVIRAVIRFL